MTRRWYSPSIPDKPYDDKPAVVLVCACGEKLKTVHALCQHNADYHLPGLLSVKILVATSREWLSQQIERERVFRYPVTYSIFMDVHRRGQPMKTLTW